MKAQIAIPAEREGRPVPPDLAQWREQMGEAIAAGAFAADPPPTEESFAGLRTLRVKAPGTPRGYMLQLHGGGFRMGRPEFEIPYCTALAARCGLEVIVPQYRLAPEAPFPCGLNDALTALVALREAIGEAKLIVGGSSAGGGLAASLGLLAATGQAPHIDALVLLSAWLDTTITAASFQSNAETDPLFSTQSANTAAELYLQGFDARHPLASPALAEITTFPPALINVGSGEVLRDDSVRLHGNLTRAEALSELCEIDGMEHVAVVRDMALTGASETFEAVVAFVDGVLG